ncbi:plasmid mobilization protein, partial [Allocoleopsis sp.]
MRKKTKQHLLLLEPEQKKEWKKKASLAGMTLNKYIRSCVERRHTTA